MKNYNNIDEGNSNTQTNFEKEEVYLRAKKKLDKLKGFYWHLAAYIVVNLFLIISLAINLDADESFWQFGTFATAFFWGIGLLFHFLGVFGPDLLYKLMEKNKSLNKLLNEKQINKIEKFIKELKIQRQEYLKLWANNHPAIKYRFKFDTTDNEYDKFPCTSVPPTD